MIGSGDLYGVVVERKLERNFAVCAGTLCRISRISLFGFYPNVTCRFVVFKFYGYGVRIIVVTFSAACGKRAKA